MILHGIEAGVFGHFLLKSFHGVALHSTSESEDRLQKTNSESSLSSPDQSLHEIL